MSGGFLEVQVDTDLYQLSCPHGSDANVEIPIAMVYLWGRFYGTAIV